MTCSETSGNGVGATARTTRYAWSGRTAPTVDRDSLYEHGTAIDLATARSKWSTKLGNWSQAHTGQVTALTDGTLYGTTSGVGGFDYGAVGSADIASKQLRWQVRVQEHLPRSERTPVICSPTVWQDKVWVGCDGGFLYTFDASNGTRKHEFKTGGAVRSAPSVSTQDGILYFGSDDGKLYALDANTGQPKWSFTTGGKVQSSPWIARGVIYFGSDDGNVYAIEGK